jgi:hypothetical protein
MLAAAAGPDAEPAAQHRVAPDGRWWRKSGRG